MKRALLEATVFLSSLACAHAQQVTDSAGVVPAEGKFIKLNKEPEFPGGLTALMRYINENIQYPDTAFIENTQGIVTLLFTIDKEGRAINARVEHGIGNGCDEEALKLVAGMPSWSPGVYKGKYVEVLYRLPVHFVIPDKIQAEGDVPDQPLVYRYVEQAAEFPGGKAALIKYLTAEIPELKDNKQPGDAVLEFLVRSNGKVKQIELQRSGCDNAGLEKKLSAITDRIPRWKPAKANGKAVNAYYNISINEL